MMDLRPYRTQAAKLSDYLPWAALAAPGIVLNKDGAFQRTLMFRGPDLDSSSLPELMGTSARLANALRRFGSGWCLHAEARRRPAPGYPESRFDDGLAWLIDEERRVLFETAGARFEAEYFLTLTFLPPPERQGRLESVLFEGGSSAAPSADYRAHLARFTEEAGQFRSAIEPLVPEARWLDDQETLGFLHDSVSDRRLDRLGVPETPFHLDALLTDTPLVGGLSPKLGSHYLRILSVRSFVSASEPGLLDALNRLPLSYRWVTRFLPLSPEEARREIERTRKRWFSKRKGLMTLLREALFREESALQDNDAASQASDADAALQTVLGEGCGAGYGTLTITVAETSEAAADDSVRLIRQTTDALGFVTELESVNAVEAWLGSLPGQAYADVRRPIILTPNLAHLLPTSAVWPGEGWNAHLGGPPLMLAATDGSTPFRLNLHAGDTGHTLVIGPTGAGKSVLIATLIAQWMRYRDAQVFVFDTGRSCRAMVLGLGGTFFDPDAADTTGLAPGFQPLAQIDQPGARAWAESWLCDLIAAEGVALAPDLRMELARALQLLSARPVQERTLSLLAAFVQDVSLRAALQPFTHSGALGALLDQDREGLGEARVTAFEVGALLRQPRAARSVLPVIFRSLEARFDGRPSLLVLDEAWLYLKDTAFAAEIETWLKTLRKQNVAVIFASQALADVTRSPIAASVLENCPTRIFLPNDRAREPATRAFYEAAGLNERQIDLIAEAIPKRDYYIAGRAGCRQIELELGPATLAFAAAGRPEDQSLIDRTLALHGPRAFARHWLKAKGLPDAGDAIGRFEAVEGATGEPSPIAQNDHSGTDLGTPAVFKEVAA
jgi:type IV secretion system protein VirB4